MVHLHARSGTGTGCLTECGLPCGSRDTTAYRDLDPERVTCPACLERTPLMSTPIRNIKYTDDALITDARISGAPRSGQTVTGYGGAIPTQYELKYAGRWHRVYMMQYGNSGTPYIRHQSADLVLTIAAEHKCEALAEGTRS